VAEKQVDVALAILTTDRVEIFRIEGQIKVSETAASALTGNSWSVN
jgi:hypothetical protein